MKHNESFVHKHFVKTGIISIDDSGFIWREYRYIGGQGKRLIKIHERADRETPNGYMQVQLYKDGKRITVSSHGLVWYHFNGAIPDGMMIHHKDENRTNNHIYNLDLVTFSWHNKHHKRIPWNKGRSCPEWHKRTVESKERNYAITIKETHDMRFIKKMRAIDIAAHYGITTRQVYTRLNEYEKR